MYTFISQSTFPSPTGLAREDEVGEKSLVVKRNLSQTLFRYNDFKNPTFFGTCYSCFKISADNIPTLWPVTRVDHAHCLPLAYHCPPSCCSEGPSASLPPGNHLPSFCKNRLLFFCSRAAYE